MDAVEAMLARRSARADVASGPVDAESIGVVLRCGDAAPSSKNARPWAFHVVSDREVLGAMADAMDVADGVETFVPLDPATGRKRADWPSTVVESAATLRTAALAIIIENRGTFSRSRRAVAGVAPELLEDALLGYSLEVVGIGAAIENMWIAATSLGLAASFVGDALVAEAQIKALLDVSGDLVGVLTLRGPVVGVAG